MKKWLSALLAALMILMMPLATMEEAMEIVVEAPEETTVEEAVVPEEEEDIEVVPAPIEEVEPEEEDIEVVAAPVEEEIFQIEDGVLVAYNGTDEVVEIPDGVVTIAAWAFAGNNIVKKVVCPDSIESIGDFAFYGCAELEAVSYGEEVEVGAYAFDGCEKLTVEEELEEEIGEESAQEEQTTAEETEEEVKEAETAEEETAEEETAEEETAEEETAEETAEAETEEAETAEEETEEEAVDEEEEEEVTDRESRAAVAIKTQPSDYTGAVGDTASFTVKATGAGLTYQWQYKTATGTTWNNSTASVATTATMTVKINEVGKHGQQYRCIVSDSSGNKATSSAATIYVTTLGIATQPSNFVGQIGNTAEFTVRASGVGLTYQWQYKTATGTSWTNSTISSAKTATITVPVNSTGKNGQQYRCVVTDGNKNTVTSKEVSISIPIVFTTQPVDYSGAVGDTASFTVKATGTSLSYQWQYKTATGTTWNNSTVSAASTATMSVKINEVGKQGQQYRCVVTDKNGNKAISNAATINVTTLGISVQPKDFSGAVGDTATFKVLASGTGLTYQWQYKTATGTTWINSTASAAITDTMTVNINAVSKHGQQYRCVITDSNKKKVTSSAAKIVVTTLGITTQPKSFTGEVGDTATFTVAASGTGLSYQWQYKTATGTTWINSTASAATTDTMTVKINAVTKNGQQYRCVITDSNKKKVTSSAAKIVVTTLGITTQPKSFTGEVGDTATFKVLASGTGLTYQWQYKTNAEGAVWTNSTASAATTDTMTVKINAVSKHGQQYRCVITDNNKKKVTSNAATINVTTLGIASQPKSYTGIIGDTATFKVLASGTGLTYQWQYKTATGTTWINSTSSAATTDTMTVKINETSKNGQQYRCVVTDSNKKSVTSNAAKIIIPVVITTQPASVSCFVGTTATFSVVAEGTGLTYQWQYQKSGATTWSNCGGTNATKDTWTVVAALTRDGYSYRCVITDAEGRTATSDAAVLTVTDEVVVGYVRYQLVDGSMTIVGYTSTTKTSYTIPETVEGYTVTKVGASAFEGNTKIKSIDLPDTITVIGKRAFANCTSLTTMN